MRNHTQLLPALLLLILYQSISTAQTATPQDCLGAIPICQQIYSESESPTGDGDMLEINPAFNCMQVETNSIWYTFTVNESGDFGFLLTPNNILDDYDWALFNITNASCTDLFDDPSLIVSCNAAGGTGCTGLTGATGDSPFNDQGFNCGANPPTTNSGFSPFNDLVPVIQGNTYVLCVSNWTGSTFGYTIDFGLSEEIGIFDEEPPFIENLNFPSDCSEEAIEISFSEPIQCATIASLNFELTGPNGFYNLTLASPSCDLGGNAANDFLIFLDPPIQAGDHVLTLDVNGNSEALDLCDNPANQVTFSFNSSELLAAANLGPDRTICDGESILLDVSSSNATAYLWQDGSTEPTFNVTQSGQYFVEVTSPCGSNRDTIEITVDNSIPSIDLGEDQVICPGENLILDVTTENASYLWQDGSTSPTLSVTQEGTYAVTVSTACAESTDEVIINFFPTIQAAFDVTSICEGESITWDVTTPNAAYLWQDGSTTAEYTVTQSGDYAVTITTPCETSTLSTTVEVVSGPPAFSFDVDSLFCPDISTISLDATSEGATYLWQDGSTMPIFSAMESGTYSVTVSNGCGIITESTTLNWIAPLNAPSFSDTILCPGQSLLLDATAESADNYQWQDSSMGPTFQVTAPGIYSVLVSNICENLSLSALVTECERCEVYIPNAFSPNKDGRNDVFEPYSDCTLEAFEMRVFNRWGALVFEASDSERSWNGEFNGQLLNIGVYIWMMSFTVVEDGKPRKVERSGEVNLLN